MWVVESSLIQLRKNRCRMECHIDNDSSKDFIYVLSYLYKKCSSGRT